MWCKKKKEKKEEEEERNPKMKCMQGNLTFS